MKKVNYIIIFSFLFIVVHSKAQSGDYFLGFKQYPFIKYNENKILTPADNEYLDNLYSKLDRIINSGEGKINIVHIGGSHIQADIYTHQIRKRLQSLQYDMNGGRGMIFPYLMAKTNNPSNYKIQYTGNWEYCKNTQYKYSCSLGLSGVAVTTRDKNTLIKVNPNPDSINSYSFNHIKIFHSISPYEIKISLNDSLYCGTYDTTLGYSYFNVPDIFELEVKIFRPDSVPGEVSIYGISLENDDPGVVYHAIGVNGAKLKSYLGCKYYSQHIAALKPDLVIFSIGTNDGNTKYFDSKNYYNEYERLIELTKIAVPDVHIMVTVPNDCYMYKRYVNQNTEIIRNEILSMATKNNYAVWDFYSIMGGLNSSMEWYRYGLMKYDRIHFNRQGYLLKGDLFVTAFLKGWEKNLAKRKQTPELNTRFLTDKNLNFSNSQE